MDERSPVMWASCLMKLVHPAFCSGGTSAPDEAKSGGVTDLA